MKETTRQKLINATYEEVYSHGYQGAALTDILRKASVHKGSMYYYFNSKKEMVLAAIQEKTATWFFDRYDKILKLDSNCLNEFIKTLKETQTMDFKRGCPVANLVQEMSNLDEDFNKTMKSIYNDFTGYIKRILDKSIEQKEMKRCDTGKLALFIVSAIEGGFLSAKASGNIQEYNTTIEILISMLSQYNIKKEYK
jgi:TetR/AcrR family transcriptional repressor of nem operon